MSFLEVDPLRQRITDMDTGKEWKGMGATDPVLCIDCERSTGAACPRHATYHWSLSATKEPGGAVDIPSFMFSQGFIAGRQQGYEECIRICMDMSAPIPEWSMGGLRPKAERDAQDEMCKHIAAIIRARGKP